ncbi:MAG TPA: hypothetical protein DCL21_00210 [Alphaproteobacteria bacterium]|nr:hypothetical protein [Alphaproteobacteria bacterium]
MDIMGYKSVWKETEGEIPQKRINVASHVWDMSKGEHFFKGFKYKNVICRKVKDISIVDDAVANSSFAVRPIGDVSGHMLVEDCTLSSLNSTDSNIPIMPNYVRDLAGRVICIAECYPLQKEASKTKLFPIGAFLMDENVEGSDLLENVFFSQFRTLDMSYEERYGLSGHEDINLHFAYDSANLHPYKLRVDSFYQDGWRIPQTEMLYVNKNEDGSVTESALSDFKARWFHSENQNNYEAFYQECGGEDYFEKLFEAGVTLVPTLEGYNANPLVDRDFNLVDYTVGKYVPDLHDLVNYVDSELPIGCIVKVVEPGYLTHKETVPAKVIVSNGSQYVSGHSADPEPLFPDLRLPHQRISSKWGDVHVPTHPKHFETPSIWGWDFKTGMFLQERGPIWDPLHYFYESVDDIIHYYQDEPMDDNYWLYEVPSEMKMRFYPVMPFEGFDILDNFEKEDRLEYLTRPYSTCKRYTENVFSANIGYHPMPIEFEYELDSWFSPELSPKQRVLSDVPLNIRDKLAEPIQCNVPAKLYFNRQVENSKNNPYWTDDSSIMADSVGEYKKDYPYLSRYLDHITSVTRVKELSKMFLDSSEDVDLGMQKSEFVSTIELPNSIDASIRDMTVAYYDLKEKSFDRIKSRHGLYQNFYGEYVMCSWNSDDSNDLTYMLKDTSVATLEQSNFSSVAIMQPPTF